MRSVVIAGLFSAVIVPAQADTTGRATVIDGDTIEVRGERIRLDAIDAPESGQTCEADAPPWRTETWDGVVCDPKIKCGVPVGEGIMAESRVTQRMAAILAADAVGYSRLNSARIMAINCHPCPSFGGNKRQYGVTSNWTKMRTSLHYLDLIE